MLPTYATRATRKHSLSVHKDGICTFVGLMTDIVLILIEQVGSFLFPSNGLGRYKSNRVEKGGRTAF